MAATVASNPILPQTQVAKQVMNLFKGALDFEQELSVFEKEAEKSFPTQTEHIMPLKHNGHVVIRTSSSSSSSSDHQVCFSRNRCIGNLLIVT